jgi:hypothetical protein
MNFSHSYVMYEEEAFKAKVSHCNLWKMGDLQIGYAFVSFNSKEEAEAAISTFNG